MACSTARTANDVAPPTPSNRPHSSLLPAILSAPLPSPPRLSFSLPRTPPSRPHPDPRSPYPVRKSAEAGGGVCEYSYQEVHAATGGFQHVVGRGGFGVVYHGYLAEPHGGQGAGVWAVAVKLMSGEHIANGIDSFMTEVAVMARVHHPNILRLEGYVVGATPILIYDYIPNGDAASYLAKARSGEVQFGWRERLRVALGCAEALTAIHANGFVHRDFKAPNVLLREDLTPVVADFGLARAVDDWKTHVETRVMGSVGYIDPIYFESGNLSKKSDTYAFGIFFLELISGVSALDGNFKELRRLVTGNDYPDAALVMDPHLAGQWHLKHVLVAFTLINQFFHPSTGPCFLTLISPRCIGPVCVCAVCCSVWCPCVMVGRNAEIVTDGFTDPCRACMGWALLQLACSGAFFARDFRKRLREKYMLPQRPFSDFWMHCLCACCAIAQEHRELRNRGWDPALGYAGNVRKFQACSPPPQMEMLADQ
ncbi:unnamed protein product [Closterium sp. Naga37s-1]|nr:unnamed protein product [Closterium sp. Naga37s-1]